jgi:hypothetical protein
MDTAPIIKPENDIVTIQEILDRLLDNGELKHRMQELKGLHERAFFNSFEMFYKSNRDLKAYACMLLLEECDRRAESIDKEYESRLAQLDTKEQNAHERYDRLTAKITALEREIQSKEKVGEEIGNGTHTRLSSLLKEEKKCSEQINGHFDKYGKKRGRIEQQRAEEKAALAVAVRDCKAYLKAYNKSPNACLDRAIDFEHNISRYIYDTLTIEWAKRDAATAKERKLQQTIEMREREEQILQRIETSRRRWSWFKRGCFVVSAVALGIGLYVGVKFLTYSKPPTPKKIETITKEEVEVVDMIPEQEPVTSRYKVVKEIGHGEELFSGRIFKGTETDSDGRCKLVFHETIVHEDGSEHEQHIFSSPFRAGVRRFDDIPDCTFLQYDLDYDSEKQRLRVLQTTVSLPRPKGLVPTTGMTYTTDVDVPISETMHFAPGLGPASGFRIIGDQFGFGKRYIEFFWQENTPGIPGKKRRVVKVLKTSEINLTNKDGKYDNKPDCIIFGHIGGPKGMIDVEAIRTGENSYELNGIRFLKKDK